MVLLGGGFEIKVSGKQYNTGYQHQLIIIKSMMIKALLAFLLCSFALANTYSYTFSAQATSKEVQPSYALGALVQDSTVAITLQIPFPTGKSLSDFQVDVMDSDNTGVIQLLSFSGYTQTVNWVVPANASYYLRVTAGLSVSHITMYYLSVTVNSNVILRLTDVLRGSVFKYFYVSPSDSGTVTITAPTSVPTVTLATMSSANKFQLASSQTLPISSTSSGINTYTVTGLSSGYYYLVFQTTVVVSVTVTFQGSSYPCPYDSNFGDYYSVFTGCVSSSGGKYNGLPCTAFNPSNMDCTACLAGYVLQDGACNLNINCGPREYIKFGSCYSVNPDCDKFDLYTGACTSCLASTSIVVNGLCVPNNVPLCETGTHLFDGKCIADSCAAVDDAGACTACSSSVYFLENGKCNQINCGEDKYFSTSLNDCTTLPKLCQSFDLVAQTCKTCVQGYFKNPLKNNACEKPEYSANCETWDFENNKCQNCKTGFIWNIYLCILSVANNCEAHQVVIQNQCVNLPENCLSINKYRICTQCAEGYQMIAGYCTKCLGSNPSFPCVTCPLNQYIDSTGSCKEASPYCSTVNQTTGFCKSCTSGNAPVNGICCPSGQSVVNGVCQTPSTPSTPTDPKKDFSEYYRYCLYYNSVKKVCTQCLRGHYFDDGDHCA